MKSIKVSQEVFDDIFGCFLKPCPICLSNDWVDVCYSNKEHDDPAVSCMMCGLLVLSATGEEEDAKKLWNSFQRFK